MMNEGRGGGGGGVGSSIGRMGGPHQGGLFKRLPLVLLLLPAVDMNKDGWMDGDKVSRSVGLTLSRRPFEVVKGATAANMLDWAPY